MKGLQTRTGPIYNKRAEPRTLKKQAGAEMCQAQIKLWFGLAWLSTVWHSLVGLGLGMGWFDMVWYTFKA